MASPVTSLRAWFDERFPLDDLKAMAQKKKVPLHRYSYWYFLGGMTLFLFGVQVLTGALLLMYYHPGADEAFESVQFIMTQVQFGWLIRSVHSWSANLLVFMAFAHLFSVLFLRSYRKPRELTWVSGILLLFLMLGFGFSGYLLPWNTLSYFATKVGTEIPAQIPIIGRPVLLFLRGGEDITGSTLTRLYGFHVAILPAVATLLIGLHLALIQWFGMSVPPRVEAEWQARPQGRREIRFFPNFVLRELMAWYVALGLLGALAALFPWSLGVKADPFASAPAGIKPEWYFLSMFQTLKLIPAKLLGMDGEMLGILAFGVVGAAALLLPFLDREKPLNTRRWIPGLACVFLGYMTVMTVYGWVAK
jgi:quinol-cytochrome oxidoreductase complex cytochrome b subunit